jgi:hypothetical protein
MKPFGVGEAEAAPGVWFGDGEGEGDEDEVYSC